VSLRFFSLSSLAGALVALAVLVGACAATGDAVIGRGDDDASTDAAVPTVAPDGDASHPGDAGPGPDACSTQCSGRCTDTAIDPLNCGACGVPCGAHETCAASTCVCALTTCATDAGAVCVDTSTDPGNCGKCGNTCPNGVCSNGTCVGPTVLATELVMPASIAVDGTNVYFTNWPGSSAPSSGVFACPLAGCATTPTQLVSNQDVADWLQDLVLVQGALYWGAGTDGVRRCTASGCSAAPGQFATATDAIATVATDGADIFWGTQTGGRILKCPAGATCASPTTLATVAGGWVSSVAVDDKNVYWIDVSTQTINAVPKGGGAVTVVATDTFSPIALVATGGIVYWTNGSAVMSAPRGGGTAIAFLVDQAPYAIATDGVSIYWTNYSSGVKGTVRKCAVGNQCTTVATIAAGQDEAFALAIDATNVYWTSNDQIHGKILKAAK
jgi:hypothetical protein